MVSVLISNVSLCALANNIAFQKMTCCCKKISDEDYSTVRINRDCCCEVKESSNQPAEITLTFNEGNQKIVSYVINPYTNHSFDIFNNNKSNLQPLNTHSPPRENIYILNSNFRI